MLEALGFDEALPETLDTLEDIVIQYLIDIFNEATRLAELHGRAKVKLDDFKFAVRKDPNKLNRMDEINRNFKIIHQNKKAFDSKTHVKNLKQIADEAGVEPQGKVSKNSSRKGKKYKKRNKKGVPQPPQLSESGKAGKAGVGAGARDGASTSQQQRDQLLRASSQQQESSQHHQQQSSQANDDDDDDDDVRDFVDDDDDDDDDD